MADPFVAEIRIFPFNFAPRGWAMCNGQILPISQNTALFSLLGTNYGGDGHSTFALPDLQGSVPMQNAELYPGESGGSKTVTLLTSEMPMHTHSVQVDNYEAELQSPGQHGLTNSSGGLLYQTGTAQLVDFDFRALSIAGGSLPHNNLMPYVTLNFCIAMQGVFPPRT
jgi:microcystin-dependent protein